MVVENKAGAGGGIGMAQVAKAQPDGYTMLMSLSSLTVLPEADKILGRAPMYQLDQLQADRALHRRSDRAGGARRRAVEDASHDFVDDAQDAVRARSPTARPATTARCTCRWRSWRRAPASR